MKKEIRQISDDGKIIRVTIADERFYIKTLDDGTFVEYPSVTWITDVGYPKGIGYFKWLANQGWDNAEKISSEARKRGSKVHQAVSSLILGNEVRMDDKFTNDDGLEEELTLSEYDCLLAFRDFHEEKKPTYVLNEYAVFNEKPRYAGTLDIICDMDAERWLLDVKTGGIWPSYGSQLSAYKHADSLPEELRPKKMGILQLDVKQNKNKKWRLTEINDEIHLFHACREIWNKEYEGTELWKKDYPVSIKLLTPS